MSTFGEPLKTFGQGLKLEIIYIEGCWHQTSKWSAQCFEQDFQQWDTEIRESVRFYEIKKWAT